MFGWEEMVVVLPWPSPLKDVLRGNEVSETIDIDT